MPVFVRSFVLVWMLALLAPHGAAAQVVSADAVTACPFTVAEVQAAVGLKFRWLPPAKTTSDGVQYAVCRGMGDGHSGMFVLNQTLVEPKNAARRLDAMLRSSLKDAEPLPGDPDNARWLAAPGMSSYRLAYIRGNVLTELMVSSPPAEALAGLRAGLLKLRRVP